MNLLSVLLECKDPAARDLIAVMGECSSAKEVIIAVQEETEKIINRLEEGEDDGWEDGDGSEKSDEIGLVERFIELIGLYRAGKVV